MFRISGHCFDKIYFKGVFRMKKLFSVMLSFVVIIGCLSITSFADETSATVYVSIANKGQLVAAQTKVKVTDIDGDNALTVNDALYATHEAVYPSGAKEGYSYYIHKDYGLSIGKLWGDTSGNFGYYINNSSCWSLADPVKNGDYLMLGDSQMEPEPMREEQFRAKVSFVRCMGEECRPGSFKWWFFAVPWLRLAPWRPQIYKILTLFHKKQNPAP